MQRRRGKTSQRQTAEEVGLPFATLSRIERGTHLPSVQTAMALARWLGWSVEQVMEAAGTPVEAADDAP